MNEFIINDENYERFVNVDSEGLMRGLVPRVYSETPVGSYANSVPFENDLELIERSNWPELCKEQKANKSRLSDLRNFDALDQNGQGFCWAYSPCAAMMLLRAVMGLPLVHLSAHALACKIFNFEDRGAWGAMAFNKAVEIGYPSEAFWPQKSMDRSNDNDETWANAAEHKFTEGFIDIDVTHPADAQLNFDQVATCLLNRLPVVSDFNWWGHSVCSMDLVDLKPNLKQQGLDDPKRWGNRIVNSWTKDWGDNGTSVLQGPKAVPNGACAPRVVTAS